MNQQELNRVVELVTRQVLAAMGQTEAEPCGSADGLEKLLVVGTVKTEIPGELLDRAAVFDLEDYRKNQNILRYDRVLIAHLSIAQLADIAQGRLGDEAACAVLYALLSGVETLILEDALSFRRFAGKGSTALYQLLEGYARTLQVFGVKPVRQRRCPVQAPPRPPRYQAPPLPAPAVSAKPNAARLVTEADAAALVKKGGPVRLPAGAIVTPAARDVFVQARVDMLRES